MRLISGRIKHRENQHGCHWRCLLLGLLDIGLAIGTAIGAIILRAAVSMYNGMAGGEGVPEPPMGRAMGIMFVTALVNGAAGFVLGMVVGGAAAAGGAQGQGAAVTAQLASLPVGFLVMAGMLSAMLPTTFGRAILVTLCHFIIGLLIAAVLGLIAYLVLA